MTTKFIAKAIKRPGALHRALGVPQGQPIPAKKVAAAASRGGRVGREARFAEELKGFHHEAPAKPKTGMDAIRSTFASKRGY